MTFLTGGYQMQVSVSGIGQQTLQLLKSASFFKPCQYKSAVFAAGIVILKRASATTVRKNTSPASFNKADDVVHLFALRKLPQLFHSL